MPFVVTRYTPRLLETAYSFDAADPWHGGAPAHFRLEVFWAGAGTARLYALSSVRADAPRFLPESLVELWRTRQVAAEDLPRLLAAIAPRLCLADRRPMLHDRWVRHAGWLAAGSGLLVLAPMTLLAMRTEDMVHPPMALLAATLGVVAMLYAVPSVAVGWGLRRRRAQMAWALAQARPEAPTPAALAAALRDRLVRDHPRIGWRCQARENTSLVGVADRWIVSMAREGNAVRLTGFGTRARRDQPFAIDLARAADLDAWYPTLAATCVWWAGRLTLERLRPGGKCTLLRDLTDSTGRTFRSGERHVVVAVDHAPREAMHIIEFDDARILLDDRHAATADFDRYVRQD
jgi:hypothetical protein